MGFVSIKKLAEAEAPHIRKPKFFAPITLSQDSNGVGKDGKPQWALRISLSKSLSEVSNFKQGDRVDVLFDTETTPPRGLLVKDDSSDWRLSQNKGSCAARLVVKLRWRDGMPSLLTTEGCQAIIVDGNILFDVPDSARFDDNLKSPKRLKK